MNDLELSIPIDESNLMDNLLEAIDRLLVRFMEIIKNARSNLAKFRSNYNTNEMNKKFNNTNIDNINGVNIEYNIPNIKYMKIILDQLYISSYDSIPLKVLSMVNNGSDIRQLKLTIFGDADSDTYSNDNKYIFMIRDYLSKLFRTDCEDGGSLNRCLMIELSRNSSKRYISLSQFKNEFSQYKDISKTSIGKGIHELESIKSDIIDYYTDISNKVLLNTNKLRRDIKKQYKESDKELYNVIYRALWHFTRMIKDVNIYVAIKNIDDDIKYIYSCLGNYNEGDK